MKKSRRSSFFLCLLAFLCLIPGMTMAQNYSTVEGTVTDETSSALVGVAVQVQDSGTLAITNEMGRYTLRNVPQGATLVFSYIGYFEQRVTVTSQQLNVQMEPESHRVDDVVVIAYGQTKKVTLTGAVSDVGSKDLLKSPAASLGNALAGRLPGVQSVQYSGIPGGDDPEIFIRGMGTLNNASPLVLVDGVERAFSQIDPNEVANISILKDASSTAVFGVRGANGVILVTTKRGTDGKPSVSFTAQAGIQQISDYLDPASSYEYATAFNTAQLTDNPALTPDQLKYSQTAIQHFKDRDMLKVYPDTDWFDYLMKDAAWQSQFNVNVSGGNETARYFVSAGMLNQDGLFETFDQSKDANFKYKRYNYRANLDLNLSKRSTLSLNVGGRVGNRNSIGGGEDYLFSNQGLLNHGMPMAAYGIDEEGRRLIADPALVGAYSGDPLANVYRTGYGKESENVLNLDIQYKLKMDFLTEGLDFNIKGSYNSSYTQQKNRTATANLSYMASLDDNGDMVLIKQGDTWPLGYEEGRWGGRDWYMEASFNYAREFGKHNVGALLLYNQSKKYYQWDAQGEIYRGIPMGYVGLVGRITYDYDTRYLLDVNVGYNGSENFARDQRYGLFPSVSVGWIPSNEKFWEPIRGWFSYLKLRASVGTVGNDATGGRRFLYLPGAFELYGGWASEWPDERTANFGINNDQFSPGARELAQGNPNVTWETATKQNYGIDMGFFNDKLTASVDIFFEDRKNILESNEAFLNGITGLQNNFINYGQVKNKGFEVTLRWEDRVGDFTYSIAPTLTYARNEVVKMAEGLREYDYLYRAGHPVGQQFGRILFEYYTPDDTEARYEAAYGKPMPDQVAAIKPGDAIYVDLNDDGVINNYDEMAIGYSDVPEYTASLNLSFGYKGFDLSMLWIGATNTSRMLGAYFRPPFGTGQQSMMNKWVYDNSWTAETADTATLPRMTFTNIPHNYDPSSTIWQIDASYVRLKNAEIGYTFRNIPKLPQVGSIRIYATGYNLLTFSKFKGNDPEARQGQWGQFIKYPLTRVYNFGVNINF